MHTNGYILALYTNRQGNKVTIRQYGESIHVEVAATHKNSSLRALSAQCAAARKRYDASKVRVSSGGSSGPNHEAVTNVYA
jgi:hypothetical protein